MDEKILSTSAAQRFYDRIGSRYDWFEFYEGRAKERAYQALNLGPGQRLLVVGVGTGKELVQMMRAITPGGSAYGLDISTVMLNLTRQRGPVPVTQGDARLLPFASRSFDRLYAAYVLDLLPYPDLIRTISGFRRVLKKSGLLVLLTLTEGVDLASRALVSAWKGLFSLSPSACGGCRPLQLHDLTRQAGFNQVERDVIVQVGVPSELIIAANR